MTALTKRQRVALATALFFAAIFLSAWASTYSASYETCQNERHTSGAKQSYFRKEVAYFLVCEGVTIGVNGELITAVATGIIAGFTATLWVTSRNQVGFMKASVEHMR